MQEINRQWLVDQSIVCTVENTEVRLVRFSVAEILLRELERAPRWEPVPNQFEYEGKRRSDPRWLVVHTIDNSGESYLVLESPEDGETVAIELPSWLALCQKVEQK